MIQPRQYPVDPARAVDAPVVFLVDDDEAVRDAIGLLLTASGLEVRAFALAESFLEFYKRSMRGCLLLDVRMPGMSGLRLQDVMVASRISLPIIFITAHGNVPTAVNAIKKGAVQFIEKPFDDEHLLALVHEALDLDAQMRREAAEGASIEARLESLTRRERQVLDKVLAGKTSREIAAELFISIKTVDFHRGRILQKLEISSLRELFPISSYLEIRPDSSAD
ncbi:MAG TPA: response regulator [Burkholderiaceae bacterium]|nr:response regulator [Burkholderiaceae bacterium]